MDLTVAEVHDTGVSVCPVRQPQEESIRVALNRLKRCAAAVTEEFLPPRRQRKAPLNKDVSERPEDTGKKWRGCLRARLPKLCEDALHKSGDMQLLSFKLVKLKVHFCGHC